MYCCMSTGFSSVVITMSEQVVPSDIAKHIIVKFVTNKNVKPAKILSKLSARFNGEMLS